VCVCIFSLQASVFRVRHVTYHHILSYRQQQFLSDGHEAEYSKANGRAG
jgi:hypothetical protein